MKSISLEQLLEAGCHFGHQVTRSNPAARDFIFEARDGIHIIDLAKTKEGLEEAGKYLKSQAQKPEINLVVVGTKDVKQDKNDEVKFIDEKLQEKGNESVFSKLGSLVQKAVDCCKE